MKKVLGGLAAMAAGAVFMVSCGGEKGMTAEQIAAEATKQFDAAKAGIEAEVAEMCDAHKADSTVMMMAEMMMDGEDPMAHSGDHAHAEGEGHGDHAHGEGHEDHAHGEEMTDADKVAHKVAEMSKAYKHELKGKCDMEVKEMIEAKMAEMEAAAGNAHSSSKGKVSKAKETAKDDGKVSATSRGGKKSDEKKVSATSRGGKKTEEKKVSATSRGGK